MRLLWSLFLLAGQLVGSSETGDLRGLVGVLTEQQTQLEATIDELRTDFSGLKEKYNTLVASTTVQRQEARWQRKTTEKLQSLAVRRRLSSAVSTQRRGLSSNACGDPSGPTLLVEGVCSCTEGLLVGGRSVTAELDKMKAFASTTISAATSTLGSTSTHSLADNINTTGNCSTGSPNSPLVVGSIIGDSTNMNLAIGLAASPDGQYVYVAGSDSDSIAVVDVGTNCTTPTVVASVDVHDRPIFVAVSPDGMYLFVIGFLSYAVVVVDVSMPTQPSVLNSVSISNFNSADGLALSPDGDYLYVTSDGTDSFAVFDVSTDPSNPTVVGSIINDSSNLDNPQGVAVAPDGKYAFVAGKSGDSISVVDIGTDPTAPVVVGITRNSTHMDGASRVAVSPDGAYLYVACGLSDTLAVVDVGIDPMKPAVVGNFVGNATYMDNPTAVMVSHDGKYVYVVGKNSNSVVVFDVGTDPTRPDVVDSVTGESTRMSGSLDAALSPSGFHLYATGSTSDSVAVISLCADKKVS